MEMTDTCINTSLRGIPQDEIKWDMSKIKLVTIDIEVKSEEGFPSPDSCSEEMLTISIQDYNTKHITTWGRKPYTPTQKNVTYHHYEEEVDMLRKLHRLVESGSP